MDNERHVEQFKNLLTNEPDLSPAIAALKVMLDFMNEDTSETIQGLEKNIKSLVEELSTVDCSVTSVKSACELFMCFITFASLDHSDIKDCKRVLSERAVKFLQKASNARSKIAKYGQKFIIDGQTVMVHSHSRVVYHTLVAAHAAKKRFHVYITESAPDYSGKLMYEKLQKAGISCTLILDAAVSTFLEKTNLVFLGAEGVATSGGIINKIGSYNIAICAKAMRKNVYVLAESFKFARVFPFNQRDLSHSLKLFTGKETPPEKHSLIDYTPPSYITLLFTDLGILHPSAVCDELYSLYV